jgi:hypothetical protein
LFIVFAFAGDSKTTTFIKNLVFQAVAGADGQFQDDLNRTSGRGENG